jgi:H3 lysine-79-specific histone-lysine N-methyltransferase
VYQHADPATRLSSMFSFFDDKPGQSGGPLVSKAKKPISKPRPVLTTPSASTSHSLTPKASSSSLKPPRPALSRPGSSSSQKGKINGNGSPARPSPTPKKRKAESRIESESESSSDDESELAQKAKKRGTTSRSTTAGLFGDGDEGSTGHGSWTLSDVDERGEWGRGWAGFVTSEEALFGRVSGWAGAEKPGGTLDKYVACEWDAT